MNKQDLIDFLSKFDPATTVADVLASIENEPAQEQSASLDDDSTNPDRDRGGRP